MRLSEHQAAFTRDLGKFLRAVQVLPHDRYRIRILEAKRSVPEQKRLKELGLSWVRNLGTAPHVEGRAVDLALDIRTDTGWVWTCRSEDYEELGELWESLSPYNRWGGRFNDGCHFERMKTKREDPPEVA